VFNGQSEALPLKIQDAASFLLRITWQDVRTISVEDRVVTFRLRGQPSLQVSAEPQDLPNLVRLIRAR
jgi:hypothetical protein